MNIRRTETPVAPPAPVLAHREAALRAPVPAAGRSGFDGTVSPRQSELARAERTLAHVPNAILPGDMPTVAPGPLPLDSDEAKAAILNTQQFLALNLNLGGVGSEGTPEFKARLVEVDDLGMTHVRMDRYQDGLPVFGEQVVAHLDRQGNVWDLTGGEVLTAIPADVSRDVPQVTRAQALQIAQGSYGKTSQHDPVIEEVLYRCADGSYCRAFRVEVTDFTCQRPERMNYMIDARSGAVLDRWNQMGGVELPKSISDMVGRPGRSDVVTVSRTAAPNVTIPSPGSVTSAITFEDEVSVEGLSLQLDIGHPWKGDLKISLTSPSGKTVVVQDQEGGAVDDVSSAFSLGEAFAGEQAKGQWTLTVEDLSSLDQGTLRSWGLTVTGRGQPAPQGDDTSLYSGQVALSTTQNADGTFSLSDGTRGKGVVTLDAQNKFNGSQAVELRDANDVWGEPGDPARSQAAVDAHYGAQMTYDLYRDVLGRDSIDGKGELLRSNVHVRSNYVNAFWDGKQMSYGDGDGRTAGPLTTLDIAGHEISHGLTERTAGLIYRGESGGINEAMSDILGTGVEWYASQRNAAVKFDWTLGEDCWTPNNGDDTDGLRYMNDPTKDDYSIDHYGHYPKQTEVHGSSGIMNNAFFLLAQGGTNRTSGIEVKDGIGVESGLRIYGRALMFYMTPSTTFAQARAACVKAATDLFGAGSVEVQKVRESWTAVGVN